MEGLRPGKGYLFRVRASNAKGQGPWSVVAAAETQAAPPEAPSQPAISQRTSTSARCKWDVPVEDHGAAVLRYRYADYCAWHEHGYSRESCMRGVCHYCLDLHPAGGLLDRKGS